MKNKHQYIQKYEVGTLTAIEIITILPKKLTTDDFINSMPELPQECLELIGNWSPDNELVTSGLIDSDAINAINRISTSITKTPNETLNKHGSP